MSRFATPRITLSILVTSLTLFVACGDDGGHTPDHDAAAVDCSTETRADTYTAGLSKTGEAGYTMLLVESQPAPPAKGDNTWTVQLLGPDSAPIDGATVTVTPYMPDHGHGTPVTAEVTPEGAGGRYTITPVNLWMPGLWEVTVDIDDAGATDAMVYKFCIDG